MRRDRVGIQCKDGTIFYIQNLRVGDCQYKKGISVRAKCFDLSKKIVDINDVIPINRDS